MLIIFKFLNPEVAKAELSKFNKSFSDPDVKFFGFLSHPENYGRELTFSFFVIVSTVDFNYSPELMKFEYDYSYPVAGELSF